MVRVTVAGMDMAGLRAVGAVAGIMTIPARLSGVFWVVWLWVL